MFVSTQNLPAIAKEYVSQVIFPKAPNQVTQFSIGFLLPYMDSMIEQRVNQMKPVLKGLGVVNEHDKIDLERARTSAMQALEKAGGKVEIFGYGADGSDIDALFSIAQRYATNE